MARIVLVTGGSRSGKSGYAQRLAEGLAGPRVYVATCPVIDDEMAERVRRHRGDRAERDWQTVEETLDLAGVLRQHDTGNSTIFLVECLTLWINNLMWEAEQAGREVGEDDVAAHCRELLATCRAVAGTVILVTNEVGMGIVPDNALARRYRDLVGRCNQTVAAEADSVTLVSCGLPIQLKP